MRKLINTPMALALAVGLAAPVAAGTSPHGADMTAMPTPPIAMAPAPSVEGQVQLVYTAITPCRLLDTRPNSARTGPLMPREEREYLVHGADLAFEQGGAEGGCGLPSDVEAVTINLTAVRPASGGYLTAWAFGEERPLASNLNLIPNQVLSNEITVAVNSEGADADLVIYAHVQTDLVADVVGYWTTPVAPQLECVELTSPEITIAPGLRLSAVSPTCPSDHTLVAGSCVSYSWDGRLVTSRTLNNAYFCAYQNSGAADMTFEVKAQCCRTVTP